MTQVEFEKRCREEHKKKESSKYMAKNIISIIIIIIGFIVFASSQSEELTSDDSDTLFGFLILMFILAIPEAILVNKINKDYSKRVSPYLENKSYESYPVNYPYSFLYPGERYPIGSGTIAYQPVVNQMQQQVTPVQQVIPVQQATPVQQVAPVQQISSAQQVQLQSVVARVEPTTQIMCVNCNQQLAIPIGNEPVMVTCPTCGNSFVHTPGC